MKYKEEATIIDKHQDAAFVWLTIKTQNIARERRPGQFVNVRTGKGLDPLLRRPFSIANTDADTLTLMIQKVGRGSELIANYPVGADLNIIGPLGNAFGPPKNPKKVLFVAGGVGIAPFLFLSSHYPDAILLFGARSQLPDLKPFEKNCSVHVATEDGSHGRRGNVLDLLRDFNPEEYTTYACGPTPMFRALSDYFEKFNNPEAYYSLETYMGCGFGACKGCSVEMADGSMKLCCVDGPVFRWNEVRL